MEIKHPNKPTPISPPLKPSGDEPVKEDKDES